MVEEFITATAAGIPFGERLQAVVTDYGPLCVGIHPYEEVLSAWGYEASPAGLERFAMRMLQAAYGRARVVEFRSALYERFGSAGIAVLERVLYAAKRGGFVTILDTSRGGSAASLASFVDVYLDDSSPLAADAVTLLPYFGFDSVEPFLSAALKRNRGVFIASIGVSPSAVHIHSAVRQSGVHAGQTVAEGIIREAARFNREAGAGAVDSGGGSIGSIGSIGLTVGTTIDSQAYSLLSHVPLSRFNGPILSFGYGWEGGRAENLAALLKGEQSEEPHHGTVIVSVSRSLSMEGPDFGALQAKIESTQNQIRSVLASVEPQTPHAQGAASKAAEEI